MLARCLESLAAQIITDYIAVSLVVVDNDPPVVPGRRSRSARRWSLAPTRLRSSTMTRPPMPVGSPH
jgi:hypothetical protein